MPKVSTFQPITLKTVKSRYGDREVQVIDADATEKKINTWLKRKGVTKPIYINQYDNKDGEVETLENYPIEVKVVDGYYNSDSRTYRVYVKEGWKTKRFVQSSKDGVLNLAKLLALVTDMVEENNAKERRDWESQRKAENLEERAEKINKQLKGTGFKINMNQYRKTFTIEKEGGYSFYESDLDEVVAKLLTLKK